eukprot:8047774-Lingulodinium_polyedra.AAC.1
MAAVVAGGFFSGRPGGQSRPGSSPAHPACSATREWAEAQEAQPAAVADVDSGHKRKEQQECND